MKIEIVDKIYLVENNNGMVYIFLNDKCVHCDNGIDLNNICYILWDISKSYNISNECEIFTSYGDDDIFNGYFENLTEVDNLESVEWEKY